MKKMIAIFIILFSTSYSFNCFAEWKKISTSNKGHLTFYIEDNNIRFNNGFVYWWQLTDNITPTSDGFYSTKLYMQGDCNLFRIKVLEFFGHFKQMGNGSYNQLKIPRKDWIYSPPNTSLNTILKSVCNY